MSGRRVPRPRLFAGRRPSASPWARLGGLLGPGLIAACAGNDAGGIATYATAGAQWQYNLVLFMLLITVGLVVVQEMSARMGAVTGKGLTDLIREKFGVRWALLAILAILISNGGTVVSEFAGIAAALELVHISRFVSVPAMAALLWWLVVKGTYPRVERFFLILCFGFLVYIPAAFMAHPDWRLVSMQTIHPGFFWATGGYALTLMAVIGTTITPYMQIILQSSVAEKGVTASDYPRGEKWDTILGCLFGDAISICIIIATAAALYDPHRGPGSVSLDSAQQAAVALRPVVGPAAEILLALGLFGASMLAGAVLPLSTAFSICEALGLQSGVTNSFEDAPVFYTLFTGLILVGATTALAIPDSMLIALMVVIQAVEGCVLPVILIFMLLIINDPEFMPALRNSRSFNFLAWLTTGTVSVVAVGYVFLTVILHGVFGLKALGPIPLQ
jgi:Mn2+/Fe2+ NRAMP family transporter